MLLETCTSSIPGYLSTAGTTASVAIISPPKTFFANFGDSKGVIAINNPVFHQTGGSSVIAKAVTIDHMPKNLKEQENIHRLG